MEKGGRRRAAPAVVPEPGAAVVRVLPDVAGPDKEFDYLAPEEVAIGAAVRVDLSGRRVGGWVVASGLEPRPGLALRPLAKVRGFGPEPAVVDLAAWAAWRWAGRRSSFLTAASADRAVTRLPGAARRPPAPPAWSASLDGLLGDLPLDRSVVARLPPAADVTGVVAGLAQRGPTLVVVPSVARAAVLAARLRRAGGDVALLPGDWAQARAGAAVVVGARAAAWGPCPGLAAAVVVDAHDAGLGPEGAPTWHAAWVVAERARRSGVPCVLVSPCPTVELLSLGPLRTVDRRAERTGWAPLEVIDRRLSDPRLGLYSERLVSLIRSEARVVCVLNRTGRARLLACAACGSLVRCERCGRALAQAGDELACPQCGLTRPFVCASCTSTVLRFLRVGVSRAREELELLAGRPVEEVTAATTSMPETDVLVGTEAVLHRLGPADGVGAVAFVDFDQELLAPRVRAGGEALGLLALAARLVGGRGGGRGGQRGRGGRVLVQTRMPEHPVVQAALLADPGLVASADLELRRALRLPPVTAVAVVSRGPAEAYAAALAALPGRPVEVLGPDRDAAWLIKADDSAVLADALAAVPRPPGRLRVAVDPARL